MKQNPRRRPATAADVKRARQEALGIATDAACAIFLTVLLDKERADGEIIKRVWREINELSDSITKGYVSIADLKRVLKDEYDIELR